MPAHLSEISPPAARATFPGFTYQFGNFLAAGNATLQVVLAEKLHGNHGFGMPSGKSAAGGTQPVGGRARLIKPARRLRRSPVRRRYT